MLSSRVFILSLIVGTAAAFASGCSGDNPVNAIENRITCKDVCERYAECFDSSYDVDHCTDRCTKDATEDSDKDDKLEACNACMDEKSCVSTVFNCADDCTPFVP